MKLFRLFKLIIIIVFILNCSEPSKLIIEKEVSGPETNSYLLYDQTSKEAAIIDVGGSIDSLIAIVKEKELTLKYFLFTHGHFDHVMGLPDIRKNFPTAKVGMHEDDYNDMQNQLEWVLNNLEPSRLKKVETGAESRKILQFDASTFETPDIFLTDKQELTIGDIKIKAIHTPGHSIGSMCFSVKNKLFTGDVLFYRTVGKTDVQNSSRIDHINSVRKLYRTLPTKTKVYPGHGRSTTIGSEKLKNNDITLIGGEWTE